MVYKGKEIKIGDVFESDQVSYSPYKVIESLENTVLFEDNDGDLTSWFNTRRMENAKLTLQKPKMKNAKFVPKQGQYYYFIGADGLVRMTFYDTSISTFDQKNVEIGNCFKTEKEAYKYKLKVVLKEGEE